MTRTAPAAQSPQTLRLLSETAVRSRRARAALLDRLRTGEVPWTDFPRLLDLAIDDRDVMGRIRVTDFLTAIPRLGPETAAAVLDESGVSPRRRLAGLTAKRRRALIDAVYRHRSRLEFTALVGSHKAEPEQAAAILRQRRERPIHFMRIDDLLDETQGATRLRGKARRARVLGDVLPSSRITDIDPAQRRRMAAELTR